MKWGRLTALTTILLSLALFFLHSGRPVSAETSPSAAPRTFEFTYEVHVPGNPAPGASHLWIPVPPSDAYQEIRDLRIESPVSYKLERDPEYGNQFAVFTPRGAPSAAGYEVKLRFTVMRREHRVALAGAKLENATAPKPDPLLARYLKPDKLVPLDGVIADLSGEQTAGGKTPLEKARRLYNYVVATMRYDKSGEGWGRGDAIWACTEKRGNCTDFHSLFIGMMRVAGIPARFETGFPLPEGKTEGEVPGYHCWAEFYINELGWVPVDASEAWKNPPKKDYFFGAHDVNRVFFTYGRDIRLSEDQKGEPLNYFIYPYAEANGQPVKNLEKHFSFRDVPATQQSAGGR